MLQRAASNAYSWWWAGHIRTKQSKWLEQSMQDMDEKVEGALRLIQEDGDSFARRAEMYYKKRPELIEFVEEAYRAFRALAERYDSLSTDLQKANTTIATCLPEQVQFAMDDEDDYLASKLPQFGNLQQGPNPNLPKVPKLPNRPMKGMIHDASKKLEGKKSSNPIYNKTKPAKSGLTKSEALEEIDKSQKDILVLQTMKEYVKSSYESGISKYWGLENEIMEKQDKVSRLQDEFSVSTMIDDNDARTLMAEAAIKSCQETLVQLQDKQEKSAEETKVENKKIEDARQRLESIKHECLPDEADNVEKTENSDRRVKELESLKEDVVGPERKKLEELREKIKEQFAEGSNGSITVSELADKIDDLVNLVINLEISVSSQTVLIERLRTEANDLQSQIRSLEENKATLLETHDLQSKLKDMEEKLYAAEELNKDLMSQNADLQTHFTEARTELEQLTEKLQSVEPEEEVEEAIQEEEGRFIEAEPKAEVASVKQDKGEEGGEDKTEQDAGASLLDSDNLEKVEKVDESQVVSSNLGTEEVNKVGGSIKASPTENLEAEGTESDGKSKKSHVSKQEDTDEGTESDGKSKGSRVSKQADEDTESDFKFKKTQVSKQEDNDEELIEKVEDEFNWQQMLLHGLEDKEKILIAEYTAILRNYKEVKKKLRDEEKKNESLFETTLQLREMRSAVLKKDQQIQSLREKLNLMQPDSSDIIEAKDSEENEAFGTTPTEEEEEEIKFLINQPKTISPIEEKLRGDIDAILEENLDFWLRFSSAFHQVQKFKTEVQDLQDEITRLKKKEEKKHDGKSHSSMSTHLKADVRAVYKHLTEKKTELTVWLEHSEMLQDELQHRISSICDIQEAITVSLKEGVETDEITFSTHQAAKFRGEVLNMKQENNRVKQELLAGIDHITALRIEIEKTLAKLNADFKLTAERKSSFRSYSISKIPLRSFLFGIKTRRHKYSSYSSAHRSSKKQSSPGS